MACANNTQTPWRSRGLYPELPALAGRARAAAALPGSADAVRRVLVKAQLDLNDLALLLSPAAAGELEALARRARDETMRHFGRARQLFAPLYLGNYCTNKCVYCGFHAGTGIERKALDEKDIKAEAKALAATGLRRVLALTGDAPKRTGADYIARAVAVLAGYFPSVGIEVQALTLEEYGRVVRAGADSMTMFQETYDQDLYADLHPAGPKRDFAFRLDAPLRAAEAGMRGLTLGALLGLGDWRFDVLMLAAHGQWLQRRCPHLELSFSLPRIRPLSEEEAGPGSAGAGSAGPGDRQENGETPGSGGGQKNDGLFTPRPVNDREFVQALTALRCFLPHAGITLSTRESRRMRDHVLPLGVTRLSAGVCTGVGGYAEAQPKSPVQFVIDDQRSVAEMAADLDKLGFQPVFADWLLPADGSLPLAGAVRSSLGGLESPLHGGRDGCTPQAPVRAVGKGA